MRADPVVDQGRVTTPSEKSDQQESALVQAETVETQTTEKDDSPIEMPKREEVPTRANAKPLKELRLDNNRTEPSQRVQSNQSDRNK